MKKIFTIFLVAAGTISFASAQSNNRKSIVYNDNKKMSNDYDQQATFGKTNTVAYNAAYFSSKEKEAKVEKINREFDLKIASLENERHLKSRNKATQIRVLQNQRKNEISKVEFHYARSNQKANSKTFGHDSNKW